MRTAVIVDVDGTLADVSGIRHYVLPAEGRRYKDFDAFHRESVNCPVNQMAVDLAHAARAAGHAVLIVTARRAMWRNHTAMWLALNGIPSDAMYMRANHDGRADVAVKRGILERIRQTYDVVHAVDDNPKVIALWEAEGIPVTIIPGWQ
jgi:phosphoglycolate phosphatase-like HAD superfamily hydrolase